ARRPRGANRKRRRISVDLQRRGASRRQATRPPASNRLSYRHSTCAAAAVFVGRGTGRRTNHLRVKRYGGRPAITMHPMRLRELNIGCVGGGTGLPSLLGGLKSNPW